MFFIFFILFFFFLLHKNLPFFTRACGCFMPTVYNESSYRGSFVCFSGEAARETEQRKLYIHKCSLFFHITNKHKPNTLLLKLQLHVEALKAEKVTLAHQTLQTKTMWNSYIWHRAVAPSIVKLHFSPSHLPSVGCCGNGC